MKVETIDYKSYGRALRIANDKIEAYVTLDVGPRIIGFNVIGGENMMFVDEKEIGTVDVSSRYGEGKEWRTFGGHRMWLSPEDRPITYYPDCEPIEHEVVNENGKAVCTFIPPVQKVNDVQHKLVITMEDGSTKMTVDHYLTNKGSETIRRGIWGITVTDKEGIAVVRHPERNTNLLPNRQVVLWPYTKMNDDRLLFGEDYIAVQQDPDMNQVPAKIGYTNYEGKIYCFNHGQAMNIEFESDYEKGEYPDFNVCCEIYTNRKILEIESLGHLHDVEPEGTISHREVWEVVPCEFKPTLNEAEIDKAMKSVWG
ncbi:MAG: hypothetical protein E7593_03025 [Ruminococcaceae bacterium]|nr:hypothetical protein [Oscillospiraceae bacterium]